MIEVIKVNGAVSKCTQRRTVGFQIKSTSWQGEEWTVGCGFDLVTLEESEVPSDAVRGDLTPLSLTALSPSSLSPSLKVKYIFSSNKSIDDINVNICFNCCFFFTNAAAYAFAALTAVAAC